MEVLEYLNIPEDLCAGLENIVDEQDDDEVL